MESKYVENPLSGLGELEREVPNPLTEYIKQKIAKENDAQRQPTELDRAFERLARTPDGQLVLNLIMRECGYHTTGLEAIGSGELSNRLLIKNEAQRHLWVIIRNFIPHDVRHLIEDPKPREKEEDDTGNVNVG